MINRQYCMQMINHVIIFADKFISTIHNRFTLRHMRILYQYYVLHQKIIINTILMKSILKLHLPFFYYFITKVPSPSHKLINYLTLFAIHLIRKKKADLFFRLFSGNFELCLHNYSVPIVN